jgi:predicted ATP-grasp superfamily ATP-dependent carboligase
LSHTIAICLRQVPGLTVHLLRTGAGGDDGFWLDGLSRYARTYTQTAAQSRDEELDVVRRALQRTGAKVLMPVDEFSIELAREAASLFGPGLCLPPLPPSDALQIMMDKSVFSERLARANLPQPKTWSLANLARVPEEAREEDFPLLAKPTQSQGGLGIVELTDRADLERFLAWREATGSTYIIQKKANGPTMCINVLFNHGRMVTACCQETIDREHDSYSYPKSVRLYQDPAMHDLARLLLGPLNWHGVANIDLVRDQDHPLPLILEVNPRYWSTTLGSMLAGINFPALCYFTALGMPPPKPVFRSIIYNHGFTGLKNAFRRKLNGQPASFNLHHSSLFHTLQDPLNITARMAQRLLRFFRPYSPITRQLLYKPNSDMDE